MGIEPTTLDTPTKFPGQSQIYFLNSAVLEIWDKEEL